MAPVVAQQWGVLSSAEIVTLAEERVNGYQQRDAWYDRLSKYYLGPEMDVASTPYNVPVLAMDSKGRPLLRPFEVGSAISSKRNYNSKKLAPIIDDYVGLKGRMPSSRVIPPEGPQGEEFAQKLTYYLMSTQALSKMDLQQASAGFLMSMLGDCCYVLAPIEDPSSDNWRVAWEVRHPRSCYPTFYRDGWRRSEVYDLITQEFFNPYEINASFANMGVRVPPDASRDQCMVTTYTSSRQRTVVVGMHNPQRAAHVEWDLKFCPVVWAWNKSPGQMGMADIGHSLDQQDFLDFLMSVLADGAVNLTYPIVVVKDPQNMGNDQIQRGPNAPPVYVQGTGGVDAVTTSGNIQPVMAMLSQTLEDITAGTGSSSVRQTGHLESSISTGRAIHAAQGPQSTRIDLWQQQMGAYIRQLNEMTLNLQERAPGLKDFDGDVFGVYKGQSFQVPFQASDINGWYRNWVRWETMVGLNDQQKLSIAYEGLAAKMWDRAYARELVGVDDPTTMDERIERDTLTDARIQGDVAKLAGGPPPGAAPGGHQGPGAPGGHPGPPGGAPGGGGGHPPAPGAAPTPQPIFRPPAFSPQGGNVSFPLPGQQQPTPPGPGRGTLPSTAQKTVTKLDDLRQVLQTIGPKLKGHVYAIGDLARQNMSDAPRLAVTDSRDYSAVLEVVRVISPKARVRQMSEEKITADLAAQRLV